LSIALFAQCEEFDIQTTRNNEQRATKTKIEYEYFASMYTENCFPCPDTMYSDSSCGDIVAHMSQFEFTHHGIDDSRRYGAIRPISKSQN
jgi:hypothetical protein